MFDTFQVTGLAETVFCGPPCPSGQDRLQTPTFQGGQALRTDAARDGRKQGVQQQRQNRPDLLFVETRDVETNTAGNVVSDPARRNNTIRPGKRRHPADGKTVTPVHVRHGETVPCDPRQAGDVSDLLQHGVILDLRQDFPVGIKQPRDPHSLDAGLRDEAAHRIFPDDLDGHGFIPP